MSFQILKMEHANRARIREGAECTSLLDTGSDDGLAHECDSHAVAADESAITSSTLAHTRREAGEITGTAAGDRRRKIFGHRRWSTTMTSKCLLAFVLSLLPSVTLQVEYYPTQISVISAPFLATGILFDSSPRARGRATLKHSMIRAQHTHIPSTLKVDVVCNCFSVFPASLRHCPWRCAFRPHDSRAERRRLPNN